MLRNLSILLIIIIFSSLNPRICAQQLLPEGRFLNDSIRIGEPVGYSLSIKYPRELQVVFPDSTYDFSPLEIRSRTYFPTRSDSVKSVDSIVYYLVSFEIDAVQKLSLPVYILSGEDSTAVYANIDSIFFSDVIQVMPDSVVLKENTSYNPLPVEFNYPFFAILLLAISLLFMFIYILFGKPIRRRLKILWLKRDFRKFINKFERSVNKFRNITSADQLLETVVIWKKYMEKLNNIPYTKLTTKEIAKMDKNPEEFQLLRSLDRSIYGEVIAVSVNEELEELKKQTEYSFKEKIKKLQNE